MINENKFLKKVRLFFSKYGLTLLAVVVLIVIWQLAVDLLHIKKYVLPSPKLVFESLFGPKAYENHWWKHIGTTVTEVLGSFVLTIVLGVLLAVVISWNKWLNRLLMPVIVLFNSIPKIALAPLFLLWFGYGVWPNIWISFMVAFFPVVINTATGLMSVDDDLLDLVNYLDASKAQVFMKIRIPNSLPYVFSAVKMSITMCIVGSIVGEFVASKSGIGFLLRDAQARIDMPTMFACLLVLAVLGMVCFGLLSLCEHLILPWKSNRLEVEA
jgi:NitT/TauT family transport system permease protein